MNCTILYGSNLPELTNVLMGMVEMSNNTMFSFNSNVSGLTDSDKLIVNEFTNLTTLKNVVIFDNYPHNVDCTIIIPNNVLNEVTNIDYLTLNENDTIVVDNFIDLLKRLTNV
jgi:hypothetical protein